MIFWVKQSKYPLALKIMKSIKVISLRQPSRKSKYSTFSQRTEKTLKTISKPIKHYKSFYMRINKDLEFFSQNWISSKVIRSSKETTSRCSQAKRYFPTFPGDSSFPQEFTNQEPSLIQISNYLRRMVSSFRRLSTTTQILCPKIG